MSFGSCHCCTDGLNSFLASRRGRAATRHEGAHGQTFGPISLLSFMKDHLQLAVGPWTFQKPATLLLILSRSEVHATRKFLKTAPPELVRELLPVLLHSVDRGTATEAMSTVINHVDGHTSMVSVLQKVHVGVAAEVMQEVPAEHLVITLSIPASALVAVVNTLRPERTADIVVEVLTEPTEVLLGGLVPLLSITQYPERAAMVANHVDLELLLCFLRAVPGKQLALFVDASAKEDFEEKGNITKLLRMVEDDPDFVLDKLVPLFARGDAPKMAMLLHSIEPCQLLKVLRRVEVEGVLCLLTNTHEELVIRIFKGPLQKAMSEIAGILARSMMKHPHMATTISLSSGQMVKVINTTNKAKQRLKGKIRSQVSKGKISRGAAPTNSFTFGDFTRGVFSRDSTTSSRQSSTRQRSIRRHLSEPTPAKAPLFTSPDHEKPWNGDSPLVDERSSRYSSQSRFASALKCCRCALEMKERA